MVRRLLLIASLMVVSATLLPVPVAAGGGCHSPMDIGISTSNETTARIENCAFQPTLTYIESGDKVTWRNDDIFGHTVTGANGSWGDEVNLAEGDSVSYTFEEEGIFPYFCAYHPSMVGAVVVGDGRGEDSADVGAAVVPVDDPNPPQDAAPASSESASTVVVVGLAVLAIAAALMGFRAWKFRRTHTPSAPTP